MLLYRPTGLAELRLVAASAWRYWPPRLDEQPIFYPTLTLEYARTIARDWNSKDASSGYIGFVTCFELEDAYAASYEVHRVGARGHDELWVPSAQLSEFNQHIGLIRVLESYPGTSYEGSLDPRSGLPSDL